VLRNLCAGLAAALLAAGAAQGQTVQIQVDSLWSVPATITTSLAAAPLRKDATTGSFEAIPGQRVPTTLRTLQTVLEVIFPGQRSSPMAVWGVRLYHSASGSGWTMPEHPINVVFTTPLVVPAGRRMICRYDIPLGRMGTVACAVAR